MNDWIFTQFTFLSKSFCPLFWIVSYGILLGQALEKHITFSKIYYMENKNIFYKLSNCTSIQYLFTEIDFIQNINIQDKMARRMQFIQSWIFDYPQKINLDIHRSLTSSRVLLIIRVLAFCILSFRYVLQISQYYSTAFNIVEYLTEFGFLLTWIYFTSVNQDYLLNHILNNKSQKLKEWINLLFEIGICLQTVITILFWVVLYDYSKPFQTVSFLKQIGIHGFPFICLLFDLFFNTYQFPARHLVIVLAIGTCYLILNLCYSLVIRPIYAPLDWVSLMCYIYIVLCFTLVLAVHNLIRIYWQRQRKQYLCEKSNDQKYIKFPSQLQQVNN